MSPERHQQVRGTFDKALDCPEEDRISYLQGVCGTDAELFAAVARLLKAHRESTLFLEQISPGRRRFGRYLISRELGRGAMGIVYEGADPLIGRAVAVKIIRLQTIGPPADAEFMRARLFREARSAGRLSHPGIVTIYDVGQEDDITFIAMERVNGPSLQQVLASHQCTISWDKALDILRQTALALDYAHAHGVIHLDIKPANIMLHDGAAVKITDFGIAKIVAAVEHTGTPGVLGTPSHMSPEQILGRPLDGKSDQFSLAAVAFRLFTGIEPFGAESAAGSLHKILYEPRPSPRALNPALTHAVDLVLQRGLKRLPDSRFPSCTEFVSAIETAARAPTPVFAAIEVKRFRDFLIDPLRRLMRGFALASRRNMLALGIALGAIAVVTAAGYFLGVFPSQQRVRNSAPRRLLIPESEAAVPRNAKSGGSVHAPSGGNKDRARRLYEEAVGYRNSGDSQRAIPLFRRSADLDYVPAMYELGETFMNDSATGAANYPEARKWFLKAASAGDSSAMVEIGGMYYLGRGGPTDFPTAAEWFSRAATKENPKALYDLGMMYESGLGVPRLPGRAKALYLRAAGIGYQAARKRLAELGQ